MKKPSDGSPSRTRISPRLNIRRLDTAVRASSIANGIVSMSDAAAGGSGSGWPVTMS